MAVHCRIFAHICANRNRLSAPTILGPTAWRRASYIMRPSFDICHYNSHIITFSARETCSMEQTKLRSPDAVQRVSGAPLIRGLRKLIAIAALSLRRSRVCGAPLRAAPRPGNGSSGMDKVTLPGRGAAR
jgi:hypothetical protein